MRCQRPCRHKPCIQAPCGSTPGIGLPFKGLVGSLFFTDSTYGVMVVIVHMGNDPLFRRRVFRRRVTHAYGLDLNAKLPVC